MEEELKFSVTMKTMVMYRFLLRHAYAGIAGIVNIVISGFALWLYFSGFGEGNSLTRGALLVAGSLFIIINPIHLFLKALKQVKLTPMFRKPLDYVVNADGIKVMQEKEEMMIVWEEVYKAVETGKDFYIYLSLTRAYIFPKDAYKGKADVFRSLLKAHLRDKQCKLKKSQADKR